MCPHPKLGLGTILGGRSRSLKLSRIAGKLNSVHRQASDSGSRYGATLSVATAWVGTVSSRQKMVAMIRIATQDAMARIGGQAWLMERITGTEEKPEE